MGVLADTDYTRYYCGCNGYGHKKIKNTLLYARVLDMKCF